MVYKVYSVRDSKTSFASPFLDTSDSSARRGFLYAFNKSESIISYAPEDFSLYCIGEFNSDSGKISPIIPEYICCAADFLNSKVGDSDA